MSSVTVAICTGMKQDLNDLLGSLIQTTCEEILVVGTDGGHFPRDGHFCDPRVKTLYAPYALNAKRNASLQAATGDILAFVDDDAVIGPGWLDAMKEGFGSAEVGIVTGPSLLSADATLWQRSAQLAMGFPPYSRRRYNPYQEGVVEWHHVIGANFAFRRVALEQTGGWPLQFPSHGEDMAIAHAMARNGWKIYYTPRAFVYHPPHSFWRQVVQIHRWGRAAKRLARAGIQRPPRDGAYALSIPLLMLFSAAYLLGEWKESWIRDGDVRLLAFCKKRVAKVRAHRD